MTADGRSSTVLHENFDSKGKLKAVIMVTQPATKLANNGILMPKWLVVMIALAFIAIAIILIAALAVVVFAPRAGLYGESCDRRSCTKGLNLKCINKTCLCTSDQFYAKGCQNKKTYLEKCNSDSNRCKNGTNTVCLDGVCKCTSNYYWSGSMCRLKNTYGQSCRQDDNCLDNLMLYCNSLNGKCLCSDKRFWDGGVCYPRKTYNEKCSNNTQCIESELLICNNGLCVCDSLYYFDSTYNICRKRLNENETCISSYQCHIPMNCSNSQCKCGQYEYHDNTTFTCNPQKSINQSCSNTHQCRTDKGLECRSNLCQCLSSIPTWSTYRDTCILQMTYSQTCLYPTDCNLNKLLVCTAGTNCSCPTTTVSTICDCIKTVNNETFWNGTSCQNALQFGQTCSNSSTNYMCQTITQGTICSGSGSSYSCKCPNLQYLNTTNNKCENQLLAYEKCINTTDCRVDLGLYCQNGSCSCNTTAQFWNGSSCVNYFTYMDSCSNSSQCASTLYCASGSISNCSCPTYLSSGSKCDCYRTSGNEYYWDSTKSLCVRALNYSQSCSYSYMCQTITQLTYCSSSNICDCASLKFFNTTSQKCEDQLLVNEKCVLSTNCRVDLGLYCKSGYCSCNSTTQFWNGSSCVNYYTYMDSCTNSSQCASTLYCASGASSNCSCPTYFSSGSKCDCYRTSGNEYYWSTTSNLCVAALNFTQSCTYDYMCQTLTQLTVCLNSICKCGSLKYFNTTNTKCEDQLLVNEKCILSSDCRIDLGLYCQSGTCLCNSTTQFWNGSACVNYYTYMDSCSNSSQCASTLYCASGSSSNCSCPTYFSSGSKCDCYRSSGNEYYWDSTNSLCLRTLNYSQSCSYSYMCQTITQLTYCSSSNICDCASLKFFNTTSQKCEDQLLVNEKCVLSTNCRVDLGLYCKSGYCSCNSTTQFWNGSSCVNYYTYMDSCTNSSQCASTLYCASGASSNCSCPTYFSSGSKCDCYRTSGNEYYWDSTNSLCLRALNYSQSCSYNHMCQTITQLTYCSSSNICDCASLKFFNTTSEKCEDQLLVNEKCVLSTNCRGDLGLYCKSGFCSCNSTSQFWNGSSCINYFTYMDSCTNSSQCASTLYCASGASSNCSCPTYFSSGSKCDCYRSSGNEYYWNNATGLCTSAVSYGGSCTSTYMCKTIEQLTTCNSGLCNCGTRGIYNSTLGKCQFCKRTDMILNGLCYTVSNGTVPSLTFNQTTSSQITAACYGESTARLAILSDASFTTTLSTSFVPIESIYVNAFKISNNNYVSNDGSWTVSTSHLCSSQPANQFCVILSKTALTTWCYQVETCSNPHYVFCVYNPS